MAIERTFTMIKPGVLQRRLVGEIITRFEKKGFRIIAMKAMMIPTETAENHYGEHLGKAFYEPLLEYMTSDPVIAMVLERENAIAALRMLAGATMAEDAIPGTIRGDLGMGNRKNIIHASDGAASAGREIAIFFKPEEILSYEDSLEEWI